MKTWNYIKLSDEVSYSYRRGCPITEVTINGWDDAEYLSDIEVLVSLYAIQNEYTNQVCVKVYYYYDFLLLNVTVLKQRLVAYVGNCM